MKTWVVTDCHSGSKLIRHVLKKGVGDGKMCRILHERFQELGCGKVVDITEQSDVMAL